MCDGNVNVHPVDNLKCSDIVSSDIGPRSKVWSESEMIDAAAHEFAEVIAVKSEVLNFISKTLTSFLSHLSR